MSKEASESVENPVRKPSDPSTGCAAPVPTTTGAGAPSRPWFQRLAGDTPPGALVEVPPCFQDRVRQALGPPVLRVPADPLDGFGLVEVCPGVLEQDMLCWARQLMASLGYETPPDQVVELAQIAVEYSLETGVALARTCRMLEGAMADMAEAQDDPWPPPRLGPRPRPRRTVHTHDRTAAGRTRPTRIRPHARGGTASPARGGAASAAGAGDQAATESVEHLLEHPVRLGPLTDLVDGVEDRRVVAVAEQPADVLQRHVGMVAQEEHGDLAR